jgi:hypothetical protein
MYHMSKKVIVAVCAGFVLGAGALFVASNVQATTWAYWFPMFKSVNMLGTRVVRYDSTHFEVVNMGSSTANYVVTLPSTTGNNGLVYVVKRRGDSLHSLSVLPSPGDTLDNVPNVDWLLGRHGDAVILIADDQANVWWSIADVLGNYGPNNP